ncbi:hypothetical protein FHS18_004085 [Paenibacillus phyllosphaerae]|uniref:SLH domain-containing protein n=1 Tax=Paenibacillus phyllosphaerae TaxID=274593 RepID=A0A7W5B0G7_9BACL|nr:S-layer homology domain-containing protein [Paenibacillus phyllosphaerae]MBB3112007.1 hypothetical protein [Paenibacillus phyllosphaerae]
MDFEGSTVQRRKLWRRITAGAFGVALLAGTLFQLQNNEGSAAVETYTVNNITELRNAVTQSNLSSDVNTINMAAGTYDLGDEPLDITEPVNLIGSGGNAEGTAGATILAASDNRVLNINDALGTFGSMKIAALTITGGTAPDSQVTTKDPVTGKETVTKVASDIYGGGGILADTGSGTLSLYNVAITNNATGDNSGYGGGLYVSGPNQGALSLDRVTIGSNMAVEHGGGMFVEGDLSVSIIRSTFESNIAKRFTGGGIAFLPETESGAGPVTISDSAFIGNEAQGMDDLTPTKQGVGGGLVISVPLTTITNSTFSGNKARDGGGGIIAAAASTGIPVLKHVTIANNSSSTGSGGGLLLNGGTPQLISSIVSGNTAASAANADVAIGAGKTAKLDDTTSMNNVLEKAASVFKTATPGGGNVIGLSANLLPLADNGGFTKTHALGTSSPALAAGGATGVSYDQRGFPRLVAAQTAAGAYESFRASIRYNRTYSGTFNFGGASGVSMTKKSETPSGLISSFQFANPAVTATPTTEQAGTAVYEISLNRTIANVNYTLKGNFELEVRAVPDLTVSVTHSGNFYQTQKKAAYTITVKNEGIKETSGTITLTNTLPTGMTLDSSVGTGWTCTGLTCTSTTSIPAKGSAALTLYVNIADNASGTVITKTAVSGGGEETADNTNNSGSDTHQIYPIPRIQTIAVPGSKTYKMGDVLAFSLTYDRNVTVTGTPSLPITIGGTTKQAVYTGGSGSQVLTFAYTVEEGLTDADGIQPGSSLVLGAGTGMASEYEAPAQLTLTSMPTTGGVRVDSVIPQISSIGLPTNGTFKAGTQLDFNVMFSENVAVQDAPTLTMDVGGETAEAVYVPNTDPGADQKKATFRYIVPQGHNDADGIELTEITLNSGSIRDGAGNDARLTLAPANTSGIRIDTVAPVMQSLDVPSSSSYNEGDTFTFTANYDEPVTVTGTPTIKFVSGETEQQAAYVSGSGTQTLRFTYTIQAGDNDADGIAFSGGEAAITLNGGTLRDVAGNAAAIKPTSNPVMNGVLVDTTVPQVTGITIPSKTYLAGDTIPMTVQMSENVNVSGTPKLSFNLGGNTVDAVYQSGSGTQTLSFAYEIPAGKQDGDGISLGTNLTLAGATITDIAGNNVNTLLPGPADYPEVKVDTIVPKVTAVTAADSYYTAGDLLQFKVQLDEAVTVVTTGGTPSLTFKLGTQSFEAPYLSGSGTAELVFGYTIQPNDANGAAAAFEAGAAIALNGAEVKDLNGNPANVVLSGIADLSGVIADSTIPTMTSMTASADKPYIAGDVMEFQVSISEPVNITGTPSLTLVTDSGERTAAYTAAASNASTLVFRYTVVSGDMDEDGIALNANLVLGGASVKDAAGNGINAALPNADTSGMQIDTLIPEITDVTYPDAGSYLEGDELTFTLDLNKPVAVTTTNGTPGLKLLIGSDEAWAVYTGGSGPVSQMTFTYTIASGDTDDNGVAPSNAIDLRGATVKDTAGNALALTLPTAVVPAMIVDTKRPAITSVTSTDGMYLAGETLSFQVKFDEAVQATVTGGKPYLAFKLGGNELQAEYASGSGTDTLTFSYNVQPDHANGESVNLADTTGLALSGGVLQDLNGNAAELALHGVSGMSGVKVDSTLPSLTAIDTPADQIYKAGSQLDFTVTASEAITIDTINGTPSLSLTIGEDTREAVFVSANALQNTLLFRYTVATGDADADGIELPAQLMLNGATIKDTAGNSLLLTVPAKDTSGIQVDTLIPTISGVTYPSAGSYLEGDELTFTLDLNKPLVVTTTGGTPALKLQIGSSEEWAVYTGGSGSLNQMTFTYTIASGDTDEDGVVPSNAIELRGATAADAAGNSLVLTLPTAAVPTMIVDTKVPAITSVTATDGFYRAGDKLSFQVKFDEAIQATTTGGKPYLAFKLGGNERTAEYVSGSGTDTLTFSYVVLMNDANGESVSLADTTVVALAGGTLQDLNGNAAELDLHGVSSMSGVKVDATLPSLTAIDTPSDEIYKAGSQLDFTVTASEAIAIDMTNGTPSLLLTVGEDTREAVFVSANALQNTLLFRYTVAPGDADADGIELPVQLTLNGAIIKDTAGNSLLLTVPAKDTSGIQVDTLIPEITGVTYPDAGSYLEGDELTFTLNLNKPVVVTTTGGTPALKLQIGTEEEWAVYSGGSGSVNQMTFTYTIASGDTDEDGVVPSNAIELRGATAADAAGNSLVLTLPTTAVPTMIVDTKVPAIISVTAIDGFYRAGDTLSFQVKFDEAIQATTTGGKPYLAFKLGGNELQAEYASGSGTDTLTFSYVVLMNDANGESVSLADTTGVALGGGTLEDLDGNAAELALHAVSSMSGVKVDATLPSLTAIDTPADEIYKAGSQLDFTVTASEAIAIDTTNGTPSLALTIGEEMREAVFVSANALQNTLLFRYTVATGDADADGIELPAQLTLNGATMKDAAGNSSLLTMPAKDTSGIQVDTLIPTISGVTYPTAGSYLEGDELTFTLNLNKPVVVTTTGGTPALKLQIGTEEEWAVYTGGSGSVNQMTFTYTIAPGDTDEDGVAPSNAIELRGATAADAAGNSLVLTLPTAVVPTMIVDTKVPAISTVTATDGFYRAGDTLSFQVKFDEPIQATTTGGKPYLAFKLGGNERTAEYVSGSGTDTLTFSYVVTASDANGEPVDLSGTQALVLSGGLLADVNGNPAQLALNGVDNMAAVIVDAVKPTIDLLDVPASKTYKAGDQLDFTVTTSESVTVEGTSGTPSIVLQIGENVREAMLVSEDASKNELLFRYTVTSGDSDLDGIALSSNQIQLNDAVITDAAGNSAVLALPVVDVSGIKLDTNVPGLTNVIWPESGNYREGQNLALTVKVNKAVTVNGTPNLTLQIGEDVAEAEYTGDSSETDTLTFAYTIADGVNDSDGIELTQLSLQGASIQDHAGNELVLTLPAASTPSVVKIDTEAPSTPVVAMDDDTLFQTAVVTVNGEAEAGTVLSVTATLEPAGTEAAAQTVTVGEDGHWSVTLSGLSEGEYALKAVATDASGNSSETRTVQFAIVPVLSLDAASYQIVRGKTRALVLTATYLDGTKKDITADAVFTFDQPSIAAMEGTSIKGLQTGTAIMKAEWSGQSITAAIKVTSPPVAGNVTDTLDLPLLLGAEGLAYTVNLDEIKAGELKINIASGEPLELALDMATLNKLLELNGNLNLELRTGSNSIRLSLPNVLAQAKKLAGENIDNLQIGVIAPGAEESAAVSEALAKLGATSPADPASFTVQVENTDGKSFELSSFGEYVTRTIGAGTEKPASGAIAVRLDPETGEFSFVPTSAFREEDGVWVAELKDRSTGVYLILEDPTTFPDVQGHWAADSIELLASMQIIKGKDDNQFDPTGSITRAEFAALLTRILAIGGETGNAKFGDINGGSWYADDVSAAAQAGIITGYSDGSFRPGAVVTRQEMAVMIMRAAEFIGVSHAEGAASETFKDQGSIPAWAQQAIQQASALGLVQGNEAGEFSPASQSSRAEAAVMLLRLMQAAQISPW